MRFVLPILLTAALAWAGDKDDDEKAEKRALAREVEDLLEEDLPEVQVTATRLARDLFDTPRAVTVVTEEEYAKRRPFVGLDVLDQRIGIWVEKRTATTSDPVMRGFSGANLLALIDGNTLTTLWGEGGYAGDDMYGKLDAYLIERIEVVRGPSSVLYGSNNLGGVIQFLTRSSRFGYTDGEVRLGGRVYADVSSADTAYRTRIENHGASARWRWLVGVTGGSFGDVRAGGDVGLQIPTSGEELAFDLKVQHELAANQELEVFLQRMDRNRTHRFYRPTQDNFNDRVATGVTYRAFDLAAWLETLELRFYYQYKKDARRFFDSNRRGWAKTRTFVTAAQASSRVGAHRLTYGVSWERDDGESPDDEQFTMHTKGQNDWVKDAPDSTWDDLGIYLQDEWDISPRWSLIAAVRLDWFRFKTSIDPTYDPPGPLDPLDDLYDDTTFAPTGGLGVVYRAAKGLNLLADVSLGFRQFAPNFGARQQAAGILVPNKMLDPVDALSFETGFKLQRDWGWLEGYVYRTELFNWQNQQFGTFQGEEYFDFNQNGVFDPEERVLVTVGDGRAYVHGVELEGWFRLHKIWDDIPAGWVLRGGFAYNYGNDRTRNEPLRHTHPPYGIVALRYETPDGRWWAEFSTTIVGSADRIPSDRIAKDPGFRRDPQNVAGPLLRADGSLPGYTVFDLRGGVRLNDQLRAEIAIENLSDKKYRRDHSRMDAAGLGVRVGITWDF